MTCDEVRRRIEELAIGEEPAELAEHLAACPACAEAFAAQRALDDLLRAVGNPPLASDLWPGIESRLRQREPAWIWALAPLAGLAAGVALVLLLARPGPVVETPTTVALHPAAVDEPAALEEDAEVLLWHVRAAAGTGLLDPSSVALTLSALPQTGGEPN